MPPRRRSHLPMTDEAFLDDPELVLIRPIPTADAVGCGENFDVRVRDKVGLIIGSYLQSGGRRRSLTNMAHARSAIRAWAADFNETCPHSALGYQAPKAFAEHFTTATESRAAPTESSARLSVAPPAPIGVSTQRTLVPAE